MTPPTPDPPTPLEIFGLEHIDDQVEALAQRLLDRVVAQLTGLEFVVSVSLRPKDRR